MAQLLVLTANGKAYILTNERPANQTNTRPVELEHAAGGRPIEGQWLMTSGTTPRIFLDVSDSELTRLEQGMRPRSRWTLTHTAAEGESGKGPQQRENLVVDQVAPMSGEQLTIHGQEAPISTVNDSSDSDSDLTELESMADLMEDLAYEESAQTQSMAMDVDPPVQSIYPDKLGIVVQTSFNVAHFGKEETYAAPHDDFDPDFPPPQGDPPTDEITQHNNKIFDQQLDRQKNEIKAGRKDMKIDAILAALQGAADKGHPIDIASFHEVNDIEEFVKQLQGRGADFGLDIKDGGFDGSSNTNAGGYVIAHGPLLMTGGEKAAQRERYPVIFNADKFQVDRVRYIPTLVAAKEPTTPPPERGVLQEVPPDKVVHTGKGLSRPLVVYTFKSKQKPGAPPLHVAVVHTKPFKGQMKFPGKDRRKVFDQVDKAYQMAQKDAQQSGALWTFVGDHYLANADLARADRGGKNKVSVGDAVRAMGLQSIDPVADTNTTEKIDKYLFTTYQPKDEEDEEQEAEDEEQEEQGDEGKKKKNDGPVHIAVRQGLESDTWLRSGREKENLREGWDEESSDDEMFLDEESSDEESSDEEDSDEESSAELPPAYLDRDSAQIADKGVITGNLVGSGGIVTLDLRPSRSAPDAPTGPLTADELAQIAAGEFLASDSDLSALARTVLVSDHAMFVMITSDDANDENAVASMFQHPAQIHTSLAEAYPEYYTGGWDKPYTSKDARDPEREAEDAALDAEHGQEIATQMAAMYTMPAQGNASAGSSSSGARAEKRKRSSVEGDEGARPSSSAPHGFTHPSANAGGNQITLAFRSGPSNASGSHKRHNSVARKKKR
ncbi:hypothetical protein [Polyangium aurulentum]|uniref:hypothetical protein n=1 Tax=Polyangium aurulentum TaxID=2567896 RepID=UPI0010AEAEE7|nr:hypothetical protein [Polyangium aurulentum]UQA57790.1 hypothetical protein E8A73_042020 [Polyangium aurulentum]